MTELVSPQLAYAVGLLILGFILILLEIFVIPGFNIFGILGFLTVCSGVYVAYREGPEYAVVVGAIGVVGTLALVRLLVRNRVWNRLVLESATTRAAGYDVSKSGLEGMLGERGVAVTALRPAGRMEFGEKLVDVVTEGEFVEKGVLVEVVVVDGNRVVVQRVVDE